MGGFFRIAACPGLAPPDVPRGEPCDPAWHFRIRCSGPTNGIGLYGAFPPWFPRKRRLEHNKVWPTFPPRMCRRPGAPQWAHWGTGRLILRVDPFSNAARQHEARQRLNRGSGTVQLFRRISISMQERADRSACSGGAACAWKHVSACDASLERPPHRCWFRGGLRGSFRHQRRRHCHRASSARVRRGLGDPRLELRRFVSCGQHSSVANPASSMRLARVLTRARR